MTEKLFIFISFDLISVNKTVGKGCFELNDLIDGAEYFGFKKDDIKQGTCVTKSTLESNMSQKQIKDFTGCVNLTAMACICNTKNCNSITIDEKIPEVISEDQQFFRLYKARDVKSSIENGSQIGYYDTIYLKILNIFVLMLLSFR